MRHPKFSPDYEAEAVAAAAPKSELSDHPHLVWISETWLCGKREDGALYPIGWTTPSSMDEDWRVWAPDPQHPNQDDPLHFRQIGAARDRKGGREALKRYGLEVVGGAALEDAQPALPFLEPSAPEEQDDEPYLTRADRRMKRRTRRE